MNTVTQGLRMAIALSSVLGLGQVWAQTLSPPVAVAMPYYTGEQALRGVYTHALPPRSQALVAQADALVSVGSRYCSGQVPLTDYRRQWLQTLEAWQSLSSPALGPMVTRRSQRQIDFWPSRPQLLQQALHKGPQTLADMDRIGTPAKGFPALESLLWAPQPLPLHDVAQTCHYAGLIAQGIAAEAQAIHTELQSLAQKDWSDTPEDSSAAFAEWINQWLAGLERLRWAHIGKPLASRRGPHAEFPRLSPDANRADWLAQWQGLQAQARLRPGQYAHPPQPDRALIPIEALLMGKGHLALAQRWAQAIDRVDARMNALPASTPGARELNPLIQSMKAVTTMYQGEVAAALDVPLGFSDADGD